jgi:DNA-binding transcriptional ArsR family regulator
MPASTSFPADFAVTPRFEVFYALYTLTNPAPSPLDEWKEHALLRLPADFEKTAKRVAPVAIFWPLLADSLQGARGELTFEEMLSHLRSVSASDLRLNILSGVFHDARTVESLVSRKRSLRNVLSDAKLPGAELLKHFGLRGGDENEDATRAIEMLLAEPESFRDELVFVLERFWQTGFRRDWRALEPRLRADAVRLRARYEESSVDQFATDLKLPVSIDAKARTVRTKGGAVIPFQRIERCYFLASAFNTHRWWAKYENTGARVRVYLPVAGGSASPNAVAGDLRPAEDSVTHAAVAIQPEAVFRALGDTTRYAIATVLARTPTTSADLARTLKVSKPTITHHVQALRAAGLISEVADGGSSRLSLNSATVRGLSDAAVEHLFASTGDLALETTRKRHN